jgi:hypothetical protein
MKKAVFFISILLLFTIAMWRYIGNYYLDKESSQLSFTNHLPFLLPGAIILGIVYLMFFMKIFPKGWQKQTIAGQFCIVVAFLILAFAVMRQGSISLNFILPPKSKEMFKGVVVDRRFEREGKGTKFYYVRIQNENNSHILEFGIPRKIFRKSNVGDTIEKHFITGVFNIKYMNE